MYPEHANEQVKGANGPFPDSISGLEVDLKANKNNIKSEI